MHNRIRFRSQLLVRRSCLAILALAAVALSTCTFPPDLAAQQESARVRDAQHGFSFVPPAGWEASNLRPDPKVRLFYLGPAYRGGQANLNLIVEQDTGESFEAIAQQVKQMYPRLFNAWKLVEESPLEIGGNKAYYMSYTHRMGTLTLRQAQFFIRGKGKIYILTFAAANDAFDRLSPAIAQSTLSIKIE
jgi:hypothetical protein